MSGRVPEDDGPITPVPYQPVEERAKVRARPTLRPGPIALWAGAAALAVLLWFSLTAVSVRIQIEPPPDDVDLPGTWLKFELADRHLLRPGEHRLRAEREGYFPLEETFRVGRGADQQLAYTLVKRPGLLHLALSPAVAATVRVGEQERSGAPPPPLELEPGRHAVEVHAPRYRMHAQEVEIEGGGVAQTLEVALTPAWAEVTLSSVPGGARVRVGDEELGRTPGTFELIEGEHELEAALPGYKTWRGYVVVTANQPMTLPEIVLQEADGRLRLETRPSGAQVSVGDAVAGQTPLELELASGETHTLTFFEPGYELATREVQLASGEERTLSVSLSPRYGSVVLEGLPRGAEVRVRGRVVQPREGALRLLAVPQTIRVSKAGFASRSYAVTPQPGFTKVLAVRLEPLGQEAASDSREIRTGRGQALRWVDPGRFEMGSKRGEPGRRPNEGLQAVELRRPFYLGVNEITNGEFRRFRPEHRAQPYAGNDLDADELPATSVSWQDAARFCNWLSARDGLTPAYVESGGRLVPRRPMSTGYRLPTEAEWAWAARFATAAGGRRFPWGDALPPPRGAGNYADRTASGVVENAIAAYDDGFAVAAPVGSAAADDLGLFDLGGNVAEWVQDFYTIHPGGASTASRVDPMGPASGVHHVIRGASWMHWSERRLRLAYRDYGSEGRVDLGFRIARYAK